MNNYTIPPASTLVTRMRSMPEYRNPSVRPHAYVAEGFLSPEECTTIVTHTNNIVGYSFPGCGAKTKELEEAKYDLGMQRLKSLGLGTNNAHFQFDLSDITVSWLQHYTSGANYPMHVDSSPGQSRKMTVLCILSDEEAYIGGNLFLYTAPNFHQIPRTQGTVVVFPSWIPHEVNRVVSGDRKTLNMGFWGPPFK